MKHRIARGLRAGMALAVIIIFAGRAAAQQQVTAAPADIIRIRKLSGLGSRAKVGTPQYQSDRPAGTRPVGEWAEIEVRYDTAPDWIDGLTFRYHVMGLREDRTGPAYSLYRTTVRYIDIKEGRDHRSTVFLRPNTIKRYGELVAVAVEILYEGKTVAIESDTAAKHIPPDWWQNPRVTENPAVTVRDGYLLARSKTPFAFINVDDYEAEQ